MRPDDAATLLADIREEATRLQWPDDQGLDNVKRRSKMAISGIFGSTTPYVTDLEAISYLGFYSQGQEKRRDFDRGIGKLVNLLNTAIEDVKTFGSEMRNQAPTLSAFSRRVFIVHGHDNGLKETVARTVGKLDLEPIILHEQANEGRTIIEKFEAYADVPFCIVLLTPDDRGYSQVVGAKAARPRARQNVILELGFFLGRLGRSRVMALYDHEDGFELPSDYSGVLFVPVDQAGKWQIDLVTELKAAGIDVDANKLFERKSVV